MTEPLVAKPHSLVHDMSRVTNCSLKNVEHLMWTSIPAKAKGGRNLTLLEELHRAETPVSSNQLESMNPLKYVCYFQQKPTFR